MGRRKPLKVTILFGTGSSSVPACTGMTYATEGPIVSLATGGSPASLGRNTVGALEGINKFLASARAVAVKPNIGWDCKPEQVINTYPELAREVVVSCLEAGAEMVTVFDRIRNDARSGYISSAISAKLEALQNSGEINRIDERRLRKIESTDAGHLKLSKHYEDSGYRAHPSKNRRGLT